MGLLGILLGLTLLIGLAFRGWSVLLLAPAAALLAAAFAGEPLLAHLTQTFMPGAARFVAQFFPIFGSTVISFSKLLQNTIQHQSRLNGMKIKGISSRVFQHH